MSATIPSRSTYTKKVMPLHSNNNIEIGPAVQRLRQRRSVQNFSFLWILSTFLLMGGISQFIANIYLVPSKRAANKAAKRSEYSDYSDAPEFFQREVGGLGISEVDDDRDNYDDDFDDDDGSDRMLVYMKGFQQRQHGKISQHDNIIDNQIVNDNKRLVNSSVNRQNPVRTRTTTDAIVYLVQFGQHSSYGAQYDVETNHVLTGLDKLEKSLTKLYANYLDNHPNVDVLLFYDYQNPPTNKIIEQLSMNRPQIQFRELDEQLWSLPNDINLNRLKRPKFSMGYRHMMQWFAVLLWPYLAGEGYTHVMRMDDDSYIHTEIQYDLFDFMRRTGKKYGFRQPIIDPVHGQGYDELVEEFLTDNPNAATPEQIAYYNENRYLGFYNNWFIADISFFLTPPASELLRKIDESRIMYIERTGDLVVHSTLVRLFLRPNQIQWFRDFTYEHMTLIGLEGSKGCPQTGGVSRGIEAMTDEEWKALAQSIKARFDGKSCKRNKFIVKEEFVGAGGVHMCEQLDSSCGYYLKLLLENDNFLEKNESATPKSGLI